MNCESGSVEKNSLTWAVNGLMLTKVCGATLVMSEIDIFSRIDFAILDKPKRKRF